MRNHRVQTMRISKAPICAICEGLKTCQLEKHHDARSEIMKLENGEYILPYYEDALKSLPRAQNERCEVSEYALVRAEDAIRMGIVDSAGRVHRSLEKLDPDCLAIIEFITGDYNSTPRWTSPLVLCVMPRDQGIFEPGFALTASGSLYVLGALPMSIEALAERHPEVLKP